MNPPQLGESSRSPQRQSSPRPIPHDVEANGHAEEVEDRMGRLILGNWPGEHSSFPFSRKKINGRQLYSRHIDKNYRMWA